MLKTYETEHLLLKTLNKEAAPLVLSFYEQNRAAFEPWEPLRGLNFYTLPYHKASLTAECNLMAEGKLIRYWIFFKDAPDEIIGSICFQNILREPYQSCCIGYKISSKYQRQGYAEESIRKGIQIMFEEYHMHRIEAYIMPKNEASLNLIEKLSFTFEGSALSYARINGVWSDHKQYALINSEEMIL